METPLLVLDLLRTVKNINQIVDIAQEYPRFSITAAGGGKYNLIWEERIFYKINFAARNHGVRENRDNIAKKFKKIAMIE